MNSLLGGVDAKTASTGENVSMDQVAAAHVGYQTRFPSVHISLGGHQGAYGNTVRDLLGLRKGIFDPSEYIYDDEIDEGFDTAADSLVISSELLLEYMGAAQKSLRHALFTGETTRPAAQVIDVNVGRMRGVGGGRYINNHKDHTICRSGGKAMVYDGQSTRTMQIPGRYTITVTAAGIDRDTYPIRFTPKEGPLIKGFGIKQDDLASVSSEGRVHFN